MSSNYAELRDEKVKEIEEILKFYLPEQNGYQRIIMDAMEYSLMAGGKRLRPMLMQETYRLFGGTEKVIEPFMAAQEMIHTYSLVHDDLPAMDDENCAVEERQPMWSMVRIWESLREMHCSTMRLRQLQQHLMNIRKRHYRLVKL